MTIIHAHHFCVSIVGVLAEYQASALSKLHQVVCMWAQKPLESFF